MTEQVPDRPARDRSLETMPWIIWVDDHVTEPPDLWTSRHPRPGPVRYKFFRGNAIDACRLERIGIAQ